MRAGCGAVWGERARRAQMIVDTNLKLSDCSDCIVWFLAGSVHGADGGWDYQRDWDPGQGERHSHERVPRAGAELTEVSKVQVAQEEFPTLFLAMQNKGKHPHDPAIEAATAKVLNPYRAAKDLQAKDAPGGFLVK